MDTRHGMSKYFLDFVKVLISVIPFIVSKKDKTTRMKHIEILLEMRLLFEQLTETGNRLIDIVGERDSIDLSIMAVKELEASFIDVQTYIGMQLGRMQRISELLRESDIMYLEIPNIKKKLLKLIGSKEGGLYSIGAAIQCNLILNISTVRDGDKIDWTASGAKQNSFIKSIIAYSVDNSEFCVAKQKKILEEMEGEVSEFSKVINEYLTPSERINCLKMAKEKVNTYSYKKS
jgi:hypothetical protein